MARTEAPLSFPETPRAFSRERVALAMAIAEEAGNEVSIFLSGVSLTDAERASLGQIVALLENPELEWLVDEGRLTVAMIRPRAEHNKFGLTDSEAYHRIKERMVETQETVFELSIVFTPEMVDEFYQGDPKDRQMEIASVLGNHANRWEEFVDLMSSGPTTVLLLYSETGDAVERWRQVVGVLDIAESGPGTIRSEFGLSRYNNLVHGSDSQDAVRREVGFLRRWLGQFVAPGEE